MTSVVAEFRFLPPVPCKFEEAAAVSVYREENQYGVCAALKIAPDFLPFPQLGQRSGGCVRSLRTLTLLPRVTHYRREPYSHNLLTRHVAFYMQQGT